MTKNDAYAEASKMARVSRERRAVLLNRTNAGDYAVQEVTPLLDESTGKTGKWNLDAIVWPDGGIDYQRPHSN